MAVKRQSVNSRIDRFKHVEPESNKPRSDKYIKTSNPNKRALKNLLYV